MLLLALPLAAQIPGDVEVVHPNQRVTIPNLPAVTAADASSPAVAKAALAIALSGLKVKCGSDSQLERVVDATATPSLRTLVTRISGTFCVDNGQLLRVAGTFVPNGAIEADSLIASVTAGKPLLVEWKNGLFVLYGIVYDERRHSDGHRVNAIRELLLIDPRYSDKRRFQVFVREKDNLAEVEGVASVSVTER